MKYFLLLIILTVRIFTPMEALDKVKNLYASNFIKTYLPGNTREYYYRLEQTDYILVYEETDITNGQYLIRLYEFVVDDQKTGTGHTVTYGLYWVNPVTGEVTVYD